MAEIFSQSSSSSLAASVECFWSWFIAMGSLLLKYLNLGTITISWEIGIWLLIKIFRFKSQDTISGPENVAVTVIDAIKG